MTQTITLPLAEYLPDLPEFASSGSGRIINVYPRTPNSYGAIGSPMAISSALDARCQGAVFYLDKSGVANLFSGTVSKLYRLTRGDVYAWQDVSKVGGYHLDPEGQWEFAHFNGLALAANVADPIQSFDLASSTIFADLAAAAPQARHMAVIKNAFVVLGNTVDPIDMAQPQRVWWSAAGDATNWPAPGSTAAAQVQSGFVNLLGDDGAVQAIRGGLTAADGVVFQQYGMRRMVYAGPPQVFEFLPAQNGRGTLAPYSPVTRGGLCYFLATDGFYSTDGASCDPIGANKIDKTFFADLDYSYVNRVIGVNDQVSRMIWWLYPGGGNMNGIPNRLLGYNWQLQRWSLAELTAETFGQMISIGYSLDELYTILGYTLDTLPAPLDSPIWAGGGLQMGIFNAAHKLCYLSGPALAATVETSETQPVPGRRAMVTNSRPLIDGSGNATPAVAIGHRERQQDAVVFTAPSQLNSLGTCPVRTSGRYLRAVTTVGAGGNWTDISGVEVDILPQGTR